MAELQGGINIESYNLPVVNTDKQRRNFTGLYDEGRVLYDPWEGDTSGTTETDSKTEDDYSGKNGYTKINSRSYSKGSKKSSY